MAFKLLPVPYFCQNDNDLFEGVAGNVQCCPTSNAMLAAYLDKGMISRSKANGFDEPESYYKSKLNQRAHSCRKLRFRLESLSHKTFISRKSNS